MFHRLTVIALTLACATLAGCSGMKSIAGSRGSDTAIAAASNGAVKIDVHSVSWGGKPDRYGVLIGIQVECTATNLSSNTPINAMTFTPQPDEDGKISYAIPTGFTLTTLEGRAQERVIGPLELDHIEPGATGQPRWEGAIIEPGQSAHYLLFFRGRIFDDTKSVTLTVNAGTFNNDQNICITVPVKP